MDIVMLPLTTVVQTGEDPEALTQHNNNEMKRLVRALQEFGVMESIVYNRRTKQVVKGKGKVEAALAAGWTEIPAVVVDMDEDDQAVLELVLRAPFGRRDRKSIGERMVAMLQAGEEDMERTGWPQRTIERLTGQVPPAEPKPKNVCCPSCGNKFEM